ncbi:hypothetical protein H5410_019232 [Solanum commersonii]|uniref:Uncharacterized protein n=1 Tax=Solanum commersonii TaxID=4109 RepID=A0A9J6A4V5_SOLCO|nr:hypothetical protein H5410_019232 [Solanum commersonii]
MSCRYFFGYLPYVDMDEAEIGQPLIPVPTNITKNRFVSSLISAVDNIWNWFLHPLCCDLK